MALPAIATNRAAIVGVVENGNSAVLVTVAREPTSGAVAVVDRRQIDLTQGLPTHPHHHEGSWAVGRYLDTPGARTMTLADAVALVQRVQRAAEHGAKEALEELAGAVAVSVVGIAVRACATMPPTIEARIADARAQTYADTAMYRQALAGAAEARGWSVSWYDRERALSAGKGRASTELGRGLGPPWRAAHKLAAGAALLALAALPVSPPPALR